jgi:hypothetical protein
MVINTEHSFCFFVLFVTAVFFHNLCMTASEGLVQGRHFDNRFYIHMYIHTFIQCVNVRLRWFLTQRAICVNNRQN